MEKHEFVKKAGTGWSGVGSTNIAIANNKAYFLYIRGERSKDVTGLTANSSATTLRTKGQLYQGTPGIPIHTGK